DCLTEVLAEHVSAPENLNEGNFPVLGFKIESNPYFELVANAWIPLPTGETDITTKAIHHHGELLLTTVTMFGPGYEHVMLRRPQPIDTGRGLYSMELIDRGPHPLHHAVFVDAYTAHVPLFPPSLTITLCLWSNRNPKTWRDSAKALPMVRDHE